MRVRRILAWVVFSMGLTTLIATSDDDDDDDYGWNVTLSGSASLQSEGMGDDKIIRIAISRNDGLAYIPLSAGIALSATASRPASDVRIDWLPRGTHDAGTRAGGLGDAGFSTASMVRFSQGFTVLNLEGNLTLAPCASAADCITIQEARVHADTPDPYNLTLTLSGSLQSDSDDTPPGTYKLTIEVLDAP